MQKFACFTPCHAVIFLFLGAKEQVLANLANFAYDPVNYDYLWRLKVLDLFLNALEDNNKKIVSYAIGGICNICLGKWFILVSRL